jgi:hypothetical protein
MLLKVIGQLVGTAKRV